MKIKDAIDDSSRLKITDLENFFSVYEDKRGNYSLNLNETLYLKIGDDSISEYTLKTKAFWPLVSYLLYGTPRLSWMLMKLNDVTLEESMHIMEPGTVIKYISKENVQRIVRYILDS